MDNLKNKMVEWFECHPTALEDLSNFCGRKSKRMLNEMNKDINKVYVGDTSFSVIKRDYEKNIAVLQNDISKIYNVAKGINSNNQGWEFSLIYTSIKEEAICCYIENTNNDIDLNKKIEINHLSKSYDFNYKKAKEIIEIAYEIYLDENDKTGERLTVEDISYFLSNCDISLEELKIMGKDERRELMYKFNKMELVPSFCFGLKI